MLVPIGQQASQQIGPAQPWRVFGCSATQYEMVAATGSRVAPIDHKLLRAEARLSRRFIEEVCTFVQLFPTRRWMNVHFDDAWVRRNAEAREPRVARRLVAFQQHRL